MPHLLPTNVGKVVVMFQIKDKNPKTNININPFSNPMYSKKKSFGEISVIYDLIGVIGVGFCLLCK
jgi:hypothetical protein